MVNNFTDEPSLLFEKLEENMNVGELKEIIKNIDDNERVLLTMPELKYVHNVKEIEINPLNTENEVIDGVVLIGCKYC